MAQKARKERDLGSAPPLNGIPFRAEEAVGQHGSIKAVFPATIETFLLICTCFSL